MRVDAVAKADYMRAVATIQLKVSLQRIRPTIWRRLRVPSAISFGDLHDILQIAMGWDNSHLHQFVVAKQLVGEPDDSYGPGTVDEYTVMLDRITVKKFTYEYDFGDGWKHDIQIEKVDPLANDLELICVKGERACPPEDCGGPWGYMDILEALSKPRSELGKEMRQRFPDLTPDDFDIDAVNKQLRVIAEALKQVTVKVKVSTRPDLRRAR